MNIPEQPEPAVVDPAEVTPAWMQAALRAAGYDVEISGLAARPVGAGQVGETYRFQITYADTPPAGAPATVIGKFHSADAGTRAIAKELSLYRQEYMFYRELAISSRAAFPKPYLVLDENDRFVMLLEDFSPAIAGDQLRGITLPQARLAVCEAAKFHASHWGDNALENSLWLKSGALAQGVVTPEQLIPAWPGFRARYAAVLPPEHLAVGDAFVAHFASWNRPRPGPRSLTHNDYRPDNLLFGTTEGGPAIGIVDLQTLSFSYGALDVAYLIGGSFEGQKRCEIEQELLPLYFKALRENGVDGYGWEQFLADYRHFTFAGLTVTIAAALTVKQTERGDRMFLTMFNRHASHVRDHNALELLPC